MKKESPGTRWTCWRLPFSKSFARDRLRKEKEAGERNQLKALSGINWISICMERVELGLSCLMIEGRLPATRQMFQFWWKNLFVSLPSLSTRHISRHFVWGFVWRIMCTLCMYPINLCRCPVRTGHRNIKIKQYQETRICFWQFRFAAALISLILTGSWKLRGRPLTFSSIMARHGFPCNLFLISTHPRHFSRKERRNYASNETTKPDQCW